MDGWRNQFIPTCVCQIAANEAQLKQHLSQCVSHKCTRTQHSMKYFAFCIPCDHCQTLCSAVWYFKKTKKQNIKHLTSQASPLPLKTSLWLFRQRAPPRQPCLSTQVKSLIWDGGCCNRFWTRSCDEINRATVRGSGVTATPFAFPCAEGIHGKTLALVDRLHWSLSTYSRVSWV